MSSGCSTEVELEHAPKELNWSQLTVDYDWSRSSIQHDTMQVLAYRPYNLVKYLYYAVNIDNQSWKLDPLSSDGLQESGEWEDGTKPLRPGDYWLSTFRSCEPYIKLESIDGNLIEGGDPSSFLMKYDFSFTDPSQSPDVSGGHFPNWKDFNPEYPFFYDDGKGCYDRVAIKSDGDTVNVKFKPSSFSQRVKIGFDLELSEPEIIIDSIKADISGICRSKQLVTGYLDTDATQSGRILFNPTMTKDAQNSLLVHASKYIYGLGFLPPVSEEMKTGPGMLNMIIYSRFKAANGKYKSRTVFAGVNLFEVYENHPLTRISEDEKHRLISAYDDSIILKNPITIYGKDFIEGDNKEQGIVVWTVIEDELMDIEI